MYRALDVAGETLQALPADHGGTRHRAAYRLCLAAPDCLAIVVSQDGNVQFVHNQAGRVIVWDQLSFYKLLVADYQTDNSATQRLGDPGG